MIIVKIYKSNAKWPKKKEAKNGVANDISNTYVFFVDRRFWPEKNDHKILI